MRLLQGSLGSNMRWFILYSFFNTELCDFVNDLDSNMNLINIAIKVFGSKWHQFFVNLFSFKSRGGPINLIIGFIQIYALKFSKICAGLGITAQETFWLMFIKFPLKLRRSRCINKIKIKSGGWLVVQTGVVLALTMFRPTFQ